MGCPTGYKKEPWSRHGGGRGTGTTSHGACGLRQMSLLLWAVVRSFIRFLSFPLLFSSLPSFFPLFRAAPTAYGSSQTRGQIGAAAAGLHHSHSNARSEPHLQPTPQLMAMPDP